MFNLLLETKYTPETQEIIARMKSGAFFPNKTDSKRLSYLYSTLDRVKTYVSQQKTTTKKLSYYQRLLHVMQNTLLETNKAIHHLYEGKMVFNENFDIFELSLRRLLDQLNSLYPYKSTYSSSPFYVLYYILQYLYSQNCFGKIILPFQGYPSTRSIN